MLGSYNKEFAQEWSKVLFKSFGDKLNKLSKMDPNLLRTKITTAVQALTSNSAEKTIGIDSLSKFSNWLFRFSGDEKIEIPGQYHGNSEPEIQSHVFNI